LAFGGGGDAALNKTLRHRAERTPGFEGSDVALTERGTDRSVVVVVVVEPA
jgi:hypothetical protein